MGQAGCYECRELSGGSCGWEGERKEARELYVTNSAVGSYFPLNGQRVGYD